jgi:aminoglycoside phosphotransferase (APT) family kinase protein
MNSSAHPKNATVPEEISSILENLDEYIKAIFSDLKLTVIRVQRLGGQDSVNILVETPKQKHVLKINPWVGVLRNAIQFFDLVKEYLPKAPIPNVIAFDTSKKIIPYEYLIMSYIDHVSLREVDEFSAGTQLGEVLKEIHKIKVEGFGISTGDSEWQFTTWKETVQHSLNSKYVAELSGVLPEASIKRVAQCANEITEVTPVLLHGDISMENTLFSITDGAPHLVGILDPNTMGGDARWDISLCLRDKNTFNEGVVMGYFGTKYKENIDDETKKLTLINLLWIMGWQHMHLHKIDENNRRIFDKLLREYI